MTDVARAVADAHRREWASVLATAARVSGDLDVAEECAQDAFLTAMSVWRERGIPPNPGGWLTTTARRRALDLRRRDRTLRGKLPLLVDPEPVWPEEAPVDVFPDDRLRLVFICTHPALSGDTQVALTLRLVCGLSTSEIARAFLVSEATMAARLTRGKKKIEAARIPFRTPPSEQWPERLDSVLTVVHLLFTAGHTAPTGDGLMRVDLVERALDLARMLCVLVPGEREALGLLALLVLHDARRATRVDASGRLVLLEDQDRSRWDHRAVRHGCRLVTRALRPLPGAPPGRFALQAAIAAVHAEAPSYDDTDWPQIVGLYDVLLAVWPSPVVALNRAVAVAMVDGPAAGLALVDDLTVDGRLTGYPYLAATRADLLRRLGRDADARAAYQQALRLAVNSAERDYLTRRLAGSGTAGNPPAALDAPP